MVELESVDCSLSSTSTVQVNQKFSLLKWFKRTPTKSISYNDNDKLTTDTNNYFSSCDSVDTFYSTTTVRSFDFHTGQINGNSNIIINLDEKNNNKIGPFGTGAVKIIDNDKLFLTKTLPANVLSKERDITARYSLQNCTTSFSSCGNVRYHYENNNNKLINNRDNIKRVHVRGKRKAPSPPIINNQKNLISKDNNNNKIKDIRVSSWKKKRRQAPKPPDTIKINKQILLLKNNDDKKELMINKLDFKNDKYYDNLKPNIVDENIDDKNNLQLDDDDDDDNKNIKKITEQQQVICNDTLVLRGGLLLSKKNTGLTPTASSTTLSLNKKFNQSSTAMPRPWYKRSVFEQKDDATMATTSKSSSTNEGSLRNFFYRSFDKNTTDDKKKDIKRKSGLSILMNISELDKEAAAIVQEEQARSRAEMLLKSSNNDNIEINKNDHKNVVQDIVISNIENSPRKGTRALISKFNAIGNKTKVNVNTNFVKRNEIIEVDDKNKKYESILEIKKSNKDLTKYFSRQQQIDNDKIISIDYADKKKKTPSPNLNDKLKIARNKFFNDTKLTITPMNNDDLIIKQDHSEASCSDQNSSSINLKKKPSTTDNGTITETIENVASCSGSTTIQRQFTNIFESIDKPFMTRKSSLIDKKLKNQTTNQVADILVHAEQEQHQNEHQNKIKTTIINQQYDRVNDLKEMLKEMKHSLPKRQKQIKINGKINEPVVVDVKINNKCDYKFPERQKVSSGVQTSGNIRKIDKSNTNDFLNPVKSVSSTGTIGKKFHLMRPREFAAIEAILTNNNKNNKDDNTYANVIEKSIYANAVVLPARNHRVIPVPGNIVNSTGKEKYPEPPEIIRTLKLNKKLIKKDAVDDDGDDDDENVDEKAETMEQKMNTLAVNRLLKRLEAAIASGNHQLASGLAKDLAKLKIQCSVVRQKKIKKHEFFNVDMYIEDRLAHQGPIPLQLESTMTISQLKEKIFNEFEVPINVQRWIIGRKLADNNETTLEDLQLVEGLPIFLYLIAPVFQIAERARVNNKEKKTEIMKIDDDKKLEYKVDNNNKKKIKLFNSKSSSSDEDNVNKIKHVDRIDKQIIQDKIITKDDVNDKFGLNNKSNNEEKKKKEQEEDEEEEGAVGLVDNTRMEQYNELIMLENCVLVPNTKSIECPICFMNYEAGEGVVLRDCLHTFCRGCIESTIRYCGEAEVKCPYMDSDYTCEATLQEREIRAIVDSHIYEKHLAKSVSQAENNAGHHAFHCKTPDCPGWCIYDDNVNSFNCPVCNKVNCLTCRVVHEGKNCWEYQEDVSLSKDTDKESKKTAAMLTDMLERGEAMSCPTCDVVLMKKWGCDWLRCSMCKTEICWVTKGPRWGPLGKGDTSGGCRCGENKIKCHPQCNYCH